MNIQTFIERYKPCSEAKAWLRTQPDLQTAWDTCERADWLVWALKQTGDHFDNRIRLFLCYIIRNTPLPDGRTVWDLLTDERSRNAIEVTERYANGAATVEELYAASATAASAAYASPSAAAYAATYASPSAAAYAAYATTHKQALQFACDYFRQVFTFDEFVSVLEAQLVKE